MKFATCAVPKHESLKVIPNFTDAEIKHMADFATHLGWGAVGAGLAASATYAADIVPAAEIITLTTAGVVGSVLPDIDLEKAIPSRMLFTGLGLLLAFITLFNFRATYSIAELWLIWLGVFLAIRFGAFHLFHRLAKHRGVFHSLLAGAFFMILTAVVLAHGLGRDAVVAWMAGFFVLLGYLIHLMLDEIYSVDFAGAHIKRSFGSALKLYDYKALSVSSAMLALAMLMMPIAPPVQEFANIMKPSQVTAFFQMRLLPQAGWFKPRLPEANADARTNANTDVRTNTDVRATTDVRANVRVPASADAHISAESNITTATP
jgi:hypothetical protein